MKLLNLFKSFQNLVSSRQFLSDEVESWGTVSLVKIFLIVSWVKEIAGGSAIYHVGGFVWGLGCLVFFFHIYMGLKCLNVLHFLSIWDFKKKKKKNVSFICNII